MQIARLVLACAIAGSPAAFAAGCNRDDSVDPALKPGDIPAPPDVEAAPADAVRTPSGLASKVIRPGAGATRPKPTSRVKVHYTGWTTNGQMFETSTRG